MHLGGFFLAYLHLRQYLIANPQRCQHFISMMEMASGEIGFAHPFGCSAVDFTRRSSFQFATSYCRSAIIGSTWGRGTGGFTFAFHLISNVTASCPRTGRKHSDLLPVSCLSHSCCALFLLFLFYVGQPWAGGRNRLARSLSHENVCNVRLTCVYVKP